MWIQAKQGNDLVIVNMDNVLKVDFASNNALVWYVNGKTEEFRDHLPFWEYVTVANR